MTLMTLKYREHETGTIKSEVTKHGTHKCDTQRESKQHTATTHKLTQPGEATKQGKHTSTKTQ